MASITTEAILILLLLLLNGVFAMSEMALVAAKRSRLEQRAERGDKGARAALQLAAHPNAFLSTVQVGITLVGVLAGAYGGATIAAVVAETLRAYDALRPYSEEVSLALVVGTITYLSLILGELVPKRIALGSPERVISLVARPMMVVSKVARPLVALLTGSTNVVFRLLGLGKTTDPGVTEHDIRALVEQGEETGVVHRAEREIVENAFRLGDRTVHALMTPRPDVDWVDLTVDASELREALATATRERVLLCDGEIDQVVGVVRADELLARYLRGDPTDDATLLRTLAFKPPFVPTTMPAFRLLETFRETRQHVAVALDEYGAVAGVVTLDDLLEALLDEVPAEAADDAPSMSRRDDGSWLVDAGTPIDDVTARLDLEMSASDRQGVVTLGGFVMARLGHLPRAGEWFEWNGHRFEVVDMDKRRVDTVLVSALAPSDGTRSRMTLDDEDASRDGDAG
jgi:putative hemolysin